ncbi:MAG TPA: hypothetical protein VNN09_02000 [Candidatus Competibacteraceae bacterium]|nr:hypothetical protein [Candidatus Competibacteraceae bacterium]
MSGHIRRRAWPWLSALLLAMAGLGLERWLGTSQALPLPWLSGREMMCAEQAAHYAVDDRLQTLALDARARWLLRDQNDSLVQQRKALFRRLLPDHRGRPRALYESFVPQIGVNGILDVLEEQACHAEGHDLGRVIYATLGELEPAFQLCGNRCTSGCMHGVLMGLFTQDGNDHLTLEQAQARIDSVCRDPAIVAAGGEGSCVHGVGHAVTVLANYDMATAIAQCQRFASRPFQYFCATGAYMEFFGDGSQPEPGADSPYAPCDREAAFPAACYRYKMRFNAMRLAARGHAVDDLAELCRPLPPLQRHGCFHGLGDALRPLVMAQPPLLAEVCRHGEAADRRMCIEGVVEKAADFDPALGARICQGFSGAAQDRQACFAAAHQRMYSLDKDYSLYFMP